MDKDTAVQLAYEFINGMYDLGDDEIIILEDSAEETNDAFIFRYDSRMFVETGDPIYMVQIEFPVMVNKADGACKLRMATP